MLLELFQLAPQNVPLLLGLLQRDLHLVVLGLHVGDQLLVEVEFGVDPGDLVLLLLYELEVLPSDGVVIGFELGKGRLVVVDQLVYVQVLALLQLVDFDFEPEIQLFLQLSEPLLVLFLSFFEVVVEDRLRFVEGFLVVLLLFLDGMDVGVLVLFL